jgi:hypothetical protein
MGFLFLPSFVFVLLVWLLCIGILCCCLLCRMCVLCRLLCVGLVLLGFPLFCQIFKRFDFYSCLRWLNFWRMNVKKNLTASVGSSGMSLSVTFSSLPL